MVKFLLILFLFTPGRVEITVPQEFDTLEQCRMVGNIAVSWRSGWLFKCRRVVYL